MAPLEDTVRPPGNPEAENEYGGVPPLAVKLAEYAAVRAPFGKLLVVKARLDGLMVIEKFPLVCIPVLSVTVTEMAAVPAAVGVPVTAPLEEMVNPPAAVPENV